MALTQVCLGFRLESVSSFFREHGINKRGGREGMGEGKEKWPQEGTYGSRSVEGRRKRVGERAGDQHPHCRVR